MPGALNFHYFDSVICKVERRTIGGRQET